MDKRPKVGVGVIIIKGNKVLLGKRKNSHGEGSWCFPGGHLEFNESLENCAKREVLEETGVKIKNIRFETITNDIFKDEGKHYITIFMLDFSREKLMKLIDDASRKSIIGPLASIPFVLSHIYPRFFFVPTYSTSSSKFGWVSDSPK